MGGGHCDDIAAMIFWTVLSTMFDILVVERVMLEASTSSLSMMGWRVLYLKKLGRFGKGGLAVEAWTV